MAPHCLSPEGEHFSQQQGGLLGSEVSLAHWKSPLLPQMGKQKLDSALQLQLVECGVPIQETAGRGGGVGAASCELSEPL